MLLKIGGNELEIVRGKFVCFTRNNGEITYFTDWKDLNLELQEKFETVREELSQVMKKFISSEYKALFEAASEVYRKENEPDCGFQEPPQDIST